MAASLISPLLLGQLVKHDSERPRRAATAITHQGLADDIERYAMLQKQRAQNSAVRRHDARHAVHTVVAQENLADPAVIVPAY